jgi:hypothetical protein
LEGRIRLITRDDFYDRDVYIDVGNTKFEDAVRFWCDQHRPDVIVIDNLAQIVNADYNDPARVHQLMTFLYKLARDYNAAVIIAAHPKKMDAMNRVHLEKDPELFMEQIMGSSHFINSTGSLWALERRDDKNYTVFMGGRQRGSGYYGNAYLYLDENQWYQVLDTLSVQLEGVVNTDARFQAWQLLPDHPQTFGYKEGEGLVKSAMKSRSTYHEWITNCRRVGVVLPMGEKLMKAPSLPQIIAPGMAKKT